MNYYKLLLTLMTIFGLSGCLSSNSNYYVLSMSSEPTKIYENKGKTIGVEKITIPGYLYKREIAVAQSENQITLLGDALWGEDLDNGLTSRLIVYLQKKFNQPNVYAYPWDIEHQPQIKISIHVSRYIALGGSVYLDATWSILDMETRKRTSKLFSTSVPTNRGAVEIVSAMNKAFAQLEEEIAEAIFRVR